MKPDEARKLLGGYATGTLTSEEMHGLFMAALEDQELFDALAHEQAVKEAMDDPALRAELLDATHGQGRAGWLWWAVASVAAVVLTVVAIRFVPDNRTVQMARVETARAPELPAQAEPAPPPAAAPSKPVPAPKKASSQRAAAIPQVDAVASQPAPAPLPQVAGAPAAVAGNKEAAPPPALLAGKMMMRAAPAPVLRYAIEPAGDGRPRLKLDAAISGFAYVFEKQGANWIPAVAGGIAIAAHVPVYTPPLASGEVLVILSEQALDNPDPNAPADPTRAVRIVIP